MLMTSPFMSPTVSNGGKSLSISALNTQNMLYHHLNNIHGVPFVIDDINTNENLNLSEIVYAIVQGEEKGRMNGDGEAREIRNWSGVVITSSESPIMDAIKGNQGLKARVLHTYGIQWTISADQATLIKRVLSKNYGFTGKEFADYVAKFSLDDLHERFVKSLEIVKTLMIKKDRLTDRLAYKYATVHLTVLLVNEALGFNMSADDIASLFIRCEQDCFEERDNNIKAYNAVINFVHRNQNRFIIDQQLEDRLMNISSQYIPHNLCGKIIKYKAYWNVYLLKEVTDEILEKQKLAADARAIRKEWIKRGITKGDVDHNTCQLSINGVKKRYDCFKIDGGIPEPEGEAPTKDETPLPPTPVSDYAVDDTQAINEIFGGENV